MISILIPCKDEPRIHEMIAECEREFPGSQIIIANDKAGRGKGWAVRQALAHAQGEIVVFIDGDLDIHPRMIHRLLPFLDDYDIVVGKKVNRGILSRRILTVLSRIYIRIMFGVKVDTQTGVKVFLAKAIQEWKTDGYMFDLEILVNARKAGMRIIEIPVDITRSKRMAIKSIFKCLIESFKIWGAALSNNGAGLYKEVG